MISSRGLPEILAHEALEAVHVIAQQLGVVVEHLLEMRNDPALVDAVAMESAGELVVDAAARHLLERDGECLAAPALLPRFIASCKQQIECCRDGEISAASRSRRCADRTARCAELAILSTRARDSSPAAAGEALVVLDGGHHAGGGFERLVAALAPHLRHGQQDAAEAGPAVAIVARKVSAAEVGPAIRSEKRRSAAIRPAR